MLTYHEVVIQWKPFLLRCITPPSEKRFLLTGTRLSVCFLVSHLFELRNYLMKWRKVKQLCLETPPYMIELAGKLPRFPAVQLYLWTFIHHRCGDPPVTSALCNFRADDALGSVLVAPITAVHFVKLNNAISNWSCLVGEDGVSIPASYRFRSLYR